MPTPTSRLLELLELLQSRPLTTGREIAERLGVDRRTVRRYVNALEDLGIPIEGQRGVGGGYRIRPGFRLPPLMLDEDEVLAVSLGLLAAGRFRLAGEEAAVERALDKVHRVLPDTIRRRIEALETTVAFAARPAGGAPIGSDMALLLADAIHRRRRLTMTYVSFAGERSERVLSPFGLVIHESRWYLVAHDHARDDLRTFRADRCSEIAIADGALHPPPDGFDAVEVVSRSLARVPRRWEVDVLLDLPLEIAAARLPPALAELAPADGGTRLRMRVDSLDWTAAVLAGLDCDFVVEQPVELVGAVRRVAERLRRLSAST
ncbi:MAG TPA: YafY family protein [Gaiellaceae bacterium]|nr:YafY family protein [Gaiellaceae bacterium]